MHLSHAYVSVTAECFEIALVFDVLEATEVSAMSHESGYILNG